MLNIGPRANGDIQYEMEQRLEEMGTWLSVNGDAIYGSGAFDLPKDMHDWGQITYKETDEGIHKLFLHVFNWPLNKTITLSGIKDQPSRIYALADKSKKSIPFEHQDLVAHLNLPDEQPDKLIPVIVVEYDQKPEVIADLAAMSVSGGYSLTPRNWISAAGDVELVETARYETIPEHIKVSTSSGYKWKIYIEEAGAYNIDTSYSFQGNDNAGNIEITAAETLLSHKIMPTGKTVGEPDEDWVIDNYRSSRVGDIDFSKAGLYEIEIKVNPEIGKPVKFQWLWVEKQ